MTESRCLGNARTDRKGKVQVYIDENMYDAVVVQMFTIFGLDFYNDAGFLVGRLLF